MFISRKKHERLVKVAQEKAYSKGLKAGQGVGYQDGYLKGITSDREGIIFTHAGIIVFKGDEAEVNKSG